MKYLINNIETEQEAFYSQFESDCMAECVKAGREGQYSVLLRVAKKDLQDGKPVTFNSNLYRIKE